MSEPSVSRISFAKVVVVLAVVFGIGVGLCGLDIFLASKGIGKSTEEFGVGPLDGVSIDYGDCLDWRSDLQRLWSRAGKRLGEETA